MHSARREAAPGAESGVGMGRRVIGLDARKRREPIMASGASHPRCPSGGRRGQKIQGESSGESGVLSPTAHCPLAAWSAAAVPVATATIATVARAWSAIAAALARSGKARLRPLAFLALGQGKELAA